MRLFITEHVRAGIQRQYRGSRHTVQPYPSCGLALNVIGIAAAGKEKRESIWLTFQQQRFGTPSKPVTAQMIL